LPFCHLVIKAEKPKDSRYPSEIRTLGDQLKARRLDLELYQKDVAKLLGVDVTTIWNWENNRTNPAPKWVSIIKAFLARTPSVRHVGGSAHRVGDDFKLPHAVPHL